MAARARWWLALALLAACGAPPAARGTSLARPPSGADAAVASAPETKTCGSAGCWRNLAQQARDRGALDVANAHLRRAYEAEPSAAALLELIDAYVAAHEVRRARELVAAERSRAASLGGANLTVQLDTRLGALGSQQPARGLGPQEPSARMREGYDAQAEDRTSDALQALGDAVLEPIDPYHTSRAAAFLASHGEPLAASRARSAVRVELHERSAVVSLVPVQTWYTSQATWLGDRLAMMKLLTPIGVVQDGTGLLQVWSTDPTPKPLVQTYLRHPSHVVAPGGDGRTIVHDEGKALVVRDVRTGMSLLRLEAGGERPYAVRVWGTADKRMVMAAVGRQAKLWDARGKVLGTYELQGTTPTITRAYTGQGTYHHNILHDDPTWPTSVALSGDQRTVAVGGSDSKIRLFDRVDGSRKVLEFKWRYTERRPMGGNPDLNTPLELRFTPKGDQLLAVYNHGDVILWGVKSGKVARHVDGLCTVEEATKEVNRYSDGSTPPKAPSEAERIACGRAHTACISEDLRVVASAPATLGGVRVRQVSGSPIAMLLEQSLPSQYLSLSQSGTLATADLYGAVTLWTAPQPAAVHAVPPSQSGPLEPVLSRDGRVLQFEFLLPKHEQIAWDTFTNTRLAVASDRERVLAASEDGTLAAVHGESGIEVRDLRTRAARVKVPASVNDEPQVAFGDAGRLLVVRHQDAGVDVQACEAGAGTCRKVAVDGRADRWQWSADGRWIAGISHHDPLQVWDGASGATVFKSEGGTRHAAFSRDGSLIAWLEQKEHKPHFAVKARKPGSRPVLEAKLDGWPAWVEVSLDGTEVLVLAESGTLWRWKPWTGQMTSVQRVELIGVRRVQYSDNGRAVLLSKFDQVDICRNDAGLTRLASVYPLLSGGWLVQSATGEVEGSANAVESVVTKAVQGEESMVMDGGVGWDALVSEGLLRRVMQ